MHLTPEGFAEVEEKQAVSSQVFQNFGNIAGSVQVQQASPGGHLAMNVGDPAVQETIQQIISEFQRVSAGLGVDHDLRAEIEQEISTLREEIEARRPRKVKTVLRSLRWLAEGLPSTVTVALLQHFHALGL